uniref:RRM domain-containing protein n=1 Tax=Leersia perrieri TaxID=77586 RepID=A0A0D9XHC7_9ORYZ
MGDYGSSGMMRGNPDAGGMQSRSNKGQRVNVQQLKLMGQGHPTGLTPNLLKLFEPRPPLEFKPPVEKRKLPAYTGMSQFVSHFAEPGDPEYAPPVPTCETKAEKKDRIRKSKLEQGAAKVAEELEKYDPQSDPNATGDPYKTLFVARLNYETSEHRVKREFEAYGPIKRVRLVTDKETNKPRGYAFIEYMHTRDMKNAYKQADGRKVDNRRVLVDVERGRTVPNWRPRRLGGGLGSSRIGGENAEQKLSTSSMWADQDRRSLREMIAVQIETGKSPMKGHGKEIVKREPVNAPMTVLVSVIQEKIDTITGIGIGLGKGNEERTGIGKENMVVTVTVIVVIEIGTGIVVGIMTGTVTAVMIAIVREAGTAREIMSVQVMNGTAATCMREMLIMPTEYGYNQYEQHKSHDAYETERSKRHEHEYYQMQPMNTEPEGPEEGEAYEEGDYQYQQADEHNN